MTFVVFFKLNPRFVLNEEGESAEEVVASVSKRFGIDAIFLEVIEKKSKTHRK